MSEQTTPPQKKDYRPYSQEEVGYVQVSGTLGQMCQNCRWFRWGGCAIVEDYAPKTVVNTGWCNRWEGEPDTVNVMVTPVAIVDTNMTTTPMMTMSSERSATPEDDGGHQYYVAPRQNVIVKGVTEFIPQKQQILKDAQGRRYMFIVTSNGYKDREDEWIPAAELKSYVDGCWLDENVFRSDNPLLFWHDERLKAGDIIWADMQGKFLIELAREGDGPIAKALWDYREANPQNEMWGASWGFNYRERSAEGVYKGVRKKETTFLPLWAAANLLTVSEVLTVSKSRDEYINKLFSDFGVTNAAELLRAGPSALQDALTSAGVNAKSADPGAAPQPFMSKEAAALISQMVDAQGDMLTRLETLETKSKEAPVLPPELTAQLNTLAGNVKQIMTALELTPTQASESGDTVVDPDADPAAKAAKTDLDKRKSGGMYDPLFPGMNVPLVDTAGQ